MFGRNHAGNQKLSPARPPCAPHRLGMLTAANMAILEQAYEGQVEFVNELAEENIVLRAELERIRGGGQLDQATHVGALRGQLDIVNRLVATLERELDTERTENQRLRDMLTQVPLQKAPDSTAQTQKPEQYSWWLERFDNLEIGTEGQGR